MFPPYVIPLYSPSSIHSCHICFSLPPFTVVTSLSPFFNPELSPLCCPSIIHCLCFPLPPSTVGTFVSPYLHPQFLLLYLRFSIHNYYLWFPLTPFSANTSVSPYLHSQLSPLYPPKLLWLSGCPGDLTDYGNDPASASKFWHARSEVPSMWVG